MRPTQRTLPATEKGLVLPSQIVADGEAGVVVKENETKVWSSWEQS